MLQQRRWFTYFVSFSGLIFFLFTFPCSILLPLNSSFSPFLSPAATSLLVYLKWTQRDLNLLS